MRKCNQGNDLFHTKIYSRINSNDDVSLYVLEYLGHDMRKKKYLLLHLIVKVEKYTIYVWLQFNKSLQKSDKLSQNCSFSRWSQNYQITYEFETPSSCTPMNYPESSHCKNFFTVFRRVSGLHVRSIFHRSNTSEIPQGEIDQRIIECASSNRLGVASFVKIIIYFLIYFCQ